MLINMIIKTNDVSEKNPQDPNGHVRLTLAVSSIDYNFYIKDAICNPSVIASLMVRG